MKTKKIVKSRAPFAKKPKAPFQTEASVTEEFEAEFRALLKKYNATVFTKMGTSSGEHIPEFYFCFYAKTKTVQLIDRGNDHAYFSADAKSKL
jgi:hypothetical protein